MTSCPNETAWNESALLLFTSVRGHREISEIYKPLAYGATADVICYFIRDGVLTIRQENHDGRPTVCVSVYM